MDGAQEAPPDPLDPGVRRDEVDPLARPRAFAPLVGLARIGRISQAELGLGQDAQAYDPPFMGARGAPDPDDGDQNDRQEESYNPPADELAPHMDVVQEGLASP